MKNNRKIRTSVIICTKNRSTKVKRCVNIILKYLTTQEELIVIDQGTNNLTKQMLKTEIESKQLKYYKISSSGLGKSRNYGLYYAKGDIVSFTDDDCIITSQWIKEINSSFTKNTNIAGVFGKVLPYHPNINKNLICPCVFKKNKSNIITSFCRHWIKIGFGNNMSFRRDTLIKTGGFREWLGSGSIGESADDAEIALRLLLKGYNILYQPTAVVYHDRWLTNDEYNTQELSYICGELACYGYFAFKGQVLAKKVVKFHWTRSLLELKQSLKDLILVKKDWLKTLKYTLEKIIFRIRGIIIGLFFSLKQPL